MSYFSYNDVEIYTRKLQEWLAREDTTLMRQIQVANKALDGELPNSGSLNFSKYIKIPSDFNWEESPNHKLAPGFCAANSKLHWAKYLLYANIATEDEKYKNGLQDLLERYFDALREKGDPESQGLFNFSSPGSGDSVYRPLIVAIRIQSLTEIFELTEGLTGYSPEFKEKFINQLKVDISLGVKACLEAESGLLTNGHNFYEINESLFLARSLIFSGITFPESLEGLNITEVGEELLERATSSQLTEDGAHIERSLVYGHAALSILKSIEFIYEENENTLPEKISTKMEKLEHSLQALVHADGTLPAFSDSERSSEKYANYIDELAHEKFEDFGYTIIRGATGNDYSFIIDRGVTGTSSHSQKDVFSFELYANRNLIVADPGNYLYTNYDSTRDWVTSTASHNTIAIDGLSHSAILSGDDRLKILSDELIDGSWDFSAVSMGYDYLPGLPIVGRSIKHDFDGIWYFRDHVHSTQDHNVRVSFNLVGDKVVKVDELRYAVVKDLEPILFFDLSAKMTGDLTIEVDNGIYIIGSSQIEDSWTLSFSINAEMANIDYRIIAPDTNAGIKMITGNHRKAADLFPNLDFDYGISLIEIIHIPDDIELRTSEGNLVLANSTFSVADFLDLDVLSISNFSAESFKFLLHSEMGEVKEKSILVSSASRSEADRIQLVSGLTLDDGEVIWLDQIVSGQEGYSFLVELVINESDSGQFILNGIEVGNRVLLPRNQVQNLQLSPTETAESISISLRSFISGQTSEWKTTQVQVSESSIYLYSPSTSIRSGEKFSLVDYFGVTDADLISSYRIKFDPSAALYIGDEEVPPGEILIDSADIGNYRFSLKGNSSDIEISAFNGHEWSTPSVLNVTSRENSKIEITSPVLELDTHEDISLADCFQFWDLDGDSPQKISVYDASASGAKIMFNGSPLDPRVTYKFDISDLDGLVIVGGEGESNDRIILQIHDGLDWSDKETVFVRINETSPEKFPFGSLPDCGIDDYDNSEILDFFDVDYSDVIL